jgi:hypothetical protein
MNSNDPAGSEAQPAAPYPAASSRLDSSLELAAREFLRDRRSERRWRIFFRLAWLGLALAIAWSLLSQRAHPDPCRRRRRWYVARVRRPARRYTRFPRAG